MRLLFDMNKGGEEKMKQESLIYGIGGVLIGGAVVWFLASSAVNGHNMGMMQMMGMQSVRQGQTQNTNSIDAHFIEQMIPHHEDAIIMAKVALKKSKRESVQQLAQNIISSQSKEIEQMKAWYKNWYGKDVPTGDNVMGEHGMMSSAKQNSMHMGMMGDETDIARLEQVEDFDKTFVEEMIPHHQMAVMMAQMLKNGTNRPEMRELADNIITAQTQEINQMRKWLKEW